MMIEVWSILMQTGYTLSMFAMVFSCCYLMGIFFESIDKNKMDQYRMRN
jgi:hypothetical protein